MIGIFLIYVLPIIFMLGVAFSEVYRLRDSVKYSKFWHQYKFIYQIAFFTLVAIYNVWYALITSCLFWILHDIIINVYGLYKEWDYVGSTAVLDSMFKNFKSQFIVKLTLLLLSVLRYYRNYKNIFKFVVLNFF